jgi:hypothetical protein
VDQTPPAEGRPAFHVMLTETARYR